MPLIRTLGNHLTLLRKPLGATMWPPCCKCGRYLDSVEIVDGHEGESDFVKVLGKHHGQEQLVTIPMLSRHWTYEDAARAIRDFSWFLESAVQY